MTKKIRRRPSRHFRNVRTKKGRKRVLVNPSIKKPKHKIKEKGRIKKDERSLFRFLSSPTRFSHKEFGGGIDFQKDGNIEFISVHPGEETLVFLPEDYEVQYHTHPDKLQSPPSPDDVVALLKNKNQQAEIIFRDGRAFIITKTPDTEALSRLPTSQLLKMMDRAFSSSEGKNHEENFKKKLEDFGFIVRIDNDKNKKLDLSIDIIEPKKKTRRRMWTAWDLLDK